MNIAWLYQVKLWMLVLGIPLVGMALIFLSLGVGAFYNYKSKDNGVLKTGLMTGGVILIAWMYLFISNG